VQPLVRETAMRGTSVSETTRILRERYGHAYRRADLVFDLRQYRETAHSVAVAKYRDLRRLLARAGVVAFSISLVVPTLAHGAAGVDAPRAEVLVASSVNAAEANSPAALELIALPNTREPKPTQEPTLAPTPLPTLRPVVVSAGGTGALVTASWYGPGFYGNRLPCWQWLQATGKSIQYEPDTWGVAHKTLPCGTLLVLTHGANTITVPVVDRGPYVDGRELDLSPAVKAALGCTDLCTVLMRIP
jgi:hypothetical protein